RLGCPGRERRLAPAASPPARRHPAKPGAERRGGVAAHSRARRISKSGGLGIASRPRRGAGPYAARRCAGAGCAARARGRGGGGQIPRAQAPGAALGEVDHLGVHPAVITLTPTSAGLECMRRSRDVAAVTLLGGSVIVGTCAYPTEHDSSVHVSITPIQILLRGNDTAATATAWQM